jgi:L-threonylcarbamoyladenylate synthase
LEEISCEDRQSLVRIGREIASSGKIVVYPTDTVYGLGTNPFIEDAVEKCFKIKGREESKPFPILFSDISHVLKYVEFNPVSDNLARTFWPGGLTLVLPLRKEVKLSNRISRNGTVAVRIPDNSCCRELIEACGGSLVGTSANVSGEAPYSHPDDKRLADFALKCDYFIKGECTQKIPSTVLLIDSDERIRIVREGAIPVKRIADHLGKTSMADFS